MFKNNMNQGFEDEADKKRTQIIFGVMFGLAGLAGVVWLFRTKPEVYDD